MKLAKYLIFYAAGLLLIFATGCKKEDDLLNKKPNQSLSTPSTLNDLQQMLQNESLFNSGYPAYGETSTDDFFVDYSVWLNAYQSDRNAYVWAKEIFSSTDNSLDWVQPYSMVFNANIILQALPTIPITPANQVNANTIHGSALFFRSIAIYNLLQEFALPYKSTSANKDPGVPLPLTPDLQAKLPRGTVDGCYQQIITDLNTSVKLLPDVSISQLTPSKAGSYALLSRIYLVMGDYTNALLNANQALSLYSTLQDFNKLDPAAVPTFANFSPEEIFHASVQASDSNTSNAQVDSTLLESYVANDLRAAIFFYDSGYDIQFNSQYDKLHNLTYSLSTAELLLNKAECEARLNDAPKALNDLNSLLITRWKTGTYHAVTGLSPEQALTLILTERRKELVMTTIRWSDLRRLNQDPRFAVTLRRVLSGTTYELLPNDPRYTLPIPPIEIQLNPIPQNIR